VLRSEGDDGFARRLHERVRERATGEMALPLGQGVSAAMFGWFVVLISS
jgi:hypothetical protein